MRDNRNVHCALLALLCEVMWVASSSAQTTQPAVDPQVRIGTFDQRSVVIAYYGSPIHDRHLKKMIFEHDQAKGAADTERAAKLESQGQAEQDLAHRQLAGAAPIDNILEAMRASLPNIAAASGVVAIVNRPAYVESKVTLIDVTDRMVEELNPNQRARKAIDDRRAKEPASAEGKAP